MVILIYQEFNLNVSEQQQQDHTLHSMEVELIQQQDDDEFDDLLPPPTTETEDDYDYNIRTQLPPN